MSFAPLALIFLLLIVFFVLFVWLIQVRLWIAAWSSGARVGFGELIGMRLRRVAPGAVVNPRIAAVKAGLDTPTNILESHFLAGGNVDRVVTSLISADKAGISLDFSRAAAIDLAGRDVLEAVQTSVNPRVITTPKITAVAKDGIQLLVVTRITVDDVAISRQVQFFAHARDQGNDIVLTHPERIEQQQYRTCDASHGDRADTIIPLEQQYHATADEQRHRHRWRRL